MYLLAQLVNGLQIGAFYALIALGYTMVYGIVKLINFAHGDIMMVGAYAVLYGVTTLRLPFAAAAALAVGVCVVAGVLIERVAYKPLRKASRLSALITAIGISLLLQNLFMILFSSSARTFPDVLAGLPRLSIGAGSFSLVSVGSIAFATLLMIGLQLFVQKTRTGKAMRAVSEDLRAAQLMGINVNTTISLTFAMGSALAAVAAILYVLAYPQVQPYMGALPGIKAFTAAVLGGIGVLPGAMVGGFILGIVESLTKGYIPTEYSQLADAVVFVILILVLLLKPSGLLGRGQRIKV